MLLGDELDSPRGRIYLIKDMLESGRAATEEVVRHVDRCLSCLSCMTTCPSGVHYMHLVDHARTHIEATYRRPWHDRLVRAVLAASLPRPRLLRLVLVGARLVWPVAGWLPANGMAFKRPRAMLVLAPRQARPPSAGDRPQTHAPVGPRRARVALLAGGGLPVLHRRTVGLDGGRSAAGGAARTGAGDLKPGPRRPDHRSMRLLFCLFLVLTMPALADSRTDARKVELDRLLTALKAAPSEQAAGLLEARVKQIWLQSGSPAATLLLRRGDRDLQQNAADEAAADYDAVLALEPDLAEAFNHRAVARFQGGDYAGALRDIAATLQREPRHFDAFQVLSRIAEARGDWAGALAAWQKVLELDPRTPTGQERLDMLRRKVQGEAT